MFRQLKELQKRGYQPIVVRPIPFAPLLPKWAYLRLSSRIQTSLEQSRTSPDYYVFDGIPVYSPRYVKLPGRFDFGSYSLFYFASVRSLALRLHRIYDFSLVHGQTLLPDGFTTTRLGKELKRPSVVSERGYLRTTLQFRVSRLLLLQTLRTATARVAVCAKLADRIAELLGGRDSAYVVYTGVDASNFAPKESREAKQVLGLPDDGRIISLVGTNPIKKGIEALLDALHILRTQKGFENLTLRVIGHSGENSLIARKLSELGLESFVLFHPQVDPGDMPNWYAASDVVCLPSRREGLPNSLVEAGAIGSAVVASDVDGIPELIEDGYSGWLVNPDAPQELAEALGQALSDLGEAKLRSQRLFDKVSRSFSWEKHGNDILWVYESAIKRFLKLQNIRGAYKR